MLNHFPYRAEDQLFISVHVPAWISTNTLFYLLDRNIDDCLSLYHVDDDEIIMQPIEGKEIPMNEVRKAVENLIGKLATVTVFQIMDGERLLYGQPSTYYDDFGFNWEKDGLPEPLHQFICGSASVSA